MSNSQNLQDAIQYGTDYRLVSASIVAPSGKIIDIRMIFDEINIYEDLLSPVITGNIVLHDSNDLINQIPITGFEYITFEFEKPSTSEKYTKVFRIYKLSDRQRINAQNESYILHFCSEESLLNESCRVSKTYKSKTIDSIIRDIATNYLKISQKKFPQSQSVPTMGTHSIVIPNWHPFFAINWLSRMAINATYRSPSYVFYEDRDGFHFTPLEQLSQQPPIQKILVSPRNLGFERDKNEVDMETTMKTTYEWEMPCGFDIIQNITTGMYSGSLITVDPLRQHIDTTKFSVSKFFPNTHHLNEDSLIGDLKSRRHVALDAEYTSFLRLYPTTLGHDALRYGGLPAKKGVCPNRVEQWVVQRNMYFAALHSTRVNVSIPGDSQLRVGQVVDAKFPAFVLNDITQKTLDELYTGKYFIAALRHSMNRRTHMCYLELAKESAGAEYPHALNSTALTGIVTSI